MVNCLLPVFCQVFEQRTQRPVSISPSIVIEAKKAHKAGERSSCSDILMVDELCGRGLAALAYEIKTYDNLFCELFGQIYEICTNENFPLYGSTNFFLF